MPFNKIKVYNQLLEVDYMREAQRTDSLMGVFERDFIQSTNTFLGKEVTPTPKEGQTTMEVLFAHLTTTTEDEAIRNRIYDRERSVRIHWIRHHFDNEIDGVDVFSVRDPSGIRTYIHNVGESYVIILEPRSPDLYYLLTAYYIRGGNKNKIEKKKKRKLAEIY